MWLTERVGQAVGRSVEIRGERFLVGRAADCDLTIADDNVSRWHAYLVEHPDGSAALHDLGSANGTWVDGRQVDVVRLAGGEQLQLGDTVLVASRARPREQDATAAGAAMAPRASAIRRVLRADSAFQRAVDEQTTLQRAVRAGSRRLVVIATAVACLAGLAVLFATGTLPPGGDESAAERAVAQAGPGTVLVEAMGEDGGRSATGSGWVLDAREGLVVTNAHVVNDGVTFRVGAGGRSRPARVVSAAPCDDLALLRVADAAGLVAVPLGSQSSVRPGESVVALGYPGNASLGAELTATEGIVSVARTRYREAAPDVPAYDNVVQTDAALNPGNSGGPLVDREGRLVGVNSAARTVSREGRAIQGQSYAIGVDRVKEVVTALRRGRSAGWTGPGFDYPSAAELRDAGLTSGIFASRSVEGSPAQRAGLGREPLLLTAVDRTPVANTLASYCDAVRGRSSGETVALSFVRPGSGGRERVVRVKLA
ncbi:MAG TPA: trypsin-like peptidase domain-containing protein [Solirubrobacteraceae bacterium]|jgi:S1-C subfamily serine protease